MLPRRWFQLRLISLLTAVTLIAFCLAIGPEVFAYWSVRTLTNKEVKVDGTYVGLIVGVTPRNSQRIKWAGRRAHRHLIRALQDPNRFAAAHVVLTNMHSGGLNISSTRWNGLYLTLRADGSVDFHPEQMEDLASHWETYLATNKLNLVSQSY